MRDVKIFKKTTMFDFIILCTQVVNILFNVVPSQGNLAFKSPRGAWGSPAVCRMGTPGPAAGEQAVPLRSHWVPGLGVCQICQSQEQESLVECRRGPVIRDLYRSSVMTPLGVVLWALFALTFMDVSQMYFYLVSTPELVGATEADGISDNLWLRLKLPWLNHRCTSVC